MGFGLSSSLPGIMTDERIIAYLLEELPEEELEQFEDECFAEETWPTQLGLAEEDLIDAYLRGELPEARRLRFERNYLKTQARQERVLMAAALLRHVDQQQAESREAKPAPSAEPTFGARLLAFWRSQSFALRAAAAIALIAVIAGLAWLYLSGSRSPETFTALALNISTGDNRSEGVEAARVKLPLAADALKISLMLPEQARGARDYRVELDKETGETQALKITGRDAQSVSVVILASQLTRGRYALKLYAVKEDGAEQRVGGRYFFTVE